MIFIVVIGFIMKKDPEILVVFHIAVQHFCPIISQVSKTLPENFKLKKNRSFYSWLGRELFCTPFLYD